MRLLLITPFEADLGEIGDWTVMRANFDHLIVQKAVEAGAGIQEGQQAREDERKGQAVWAWPSHYPPCNF